MKIFNKLILILFTVSLSLGATSCTKDNSNSSDSISFNAVVTKVDSNNNRLYAESVDNGNDFGSPRYLDCSNADLIYAEFASDYLKRLSLDDFESGDEIVVLADWNSFSGNDMGMKVREIQLMTQRYGENVDRETSVKGIIENIDGSKIKVRYTTEDSLSSFFEAIGTVDCSTADIVCITSDDAFDTELSKLRVGDSIAVDLDLNELVSLDDGSYNVDNLDTDRVIVYNDVSDR